jgi:hypothetical protein
MSQYRLKTLDDLLVLMEPSQLLYHLQRLQRIVEADTSCEIYTGLFQDNVSSLYMIFHCMDQINLYYPWAKIFELHIGLWHGRIDAHVKQDVAPFKQYKNFDIS